MIVRTNRSILYANLLLLVSVTTMLSAQSCVKTVDKEDQLLSLMDQNGPLIIMGSMDACVNCKTIAPLFSDLAKKNKSITFYKANGPAIRMHEHIKNESSRQGTDFKIIGYPAFVFIKDKKITDVIVGAIPERLETGVKNFAKKSNTK